MKCVAELKAIHENAILRFEKEKMDYFQALKTKTIEFCEKEIGTALEKVANNPEVSNISCIVNFYDTEDKYGNVVVSPLYRGKTYADGTISYDHLGEYYSTEVITEYLTSFCFKVEWNRLNYRCYGVGERTGVTLKVSV